MSLFLRPPINRSKVLLVHRPPEHLFSPLRELCIQIGQVAERAARKKVCLHELVSFLYLSVAVLVAGQYRIPLEGESLRETLHLIGHNAVRTCTQNHDHLGIVDDADRARAAKEGKRMDEEHFGMEAVPFWEKLHIAVAREAEHQFRQVKVDKRSIKEHRDRTGIVLHLLAGACVDLS